MLTLFLPKNGFTSGLPGFAAMSLLCVSLCQCDDGSSTRIRGLKDEIQTLKHQIEDTQSQVSRLQSQIEASRAEKKKIEEDKAKAQDEREAVGKELEQLRKDFETYKTNYKLGMRKRAPGFPLQDFVSIDGKAYKQVVLREITETQVNFTHEGGIMKLHYKQLPEAVQAVLGFLIKDPEAPREVKVTTNKQINTQRRNERDGKMMEVEKKMRELRTEREKALRQQSEAMKALGKAEMREEPVSALKHELDQLELYLRKLANQILQTEVDLHRIRAEPLQVLPER